MVYSLAHGVGITITFMVTTILASVALIFGLLGWFNSMTKQDAALKIDLAPLREPYLKERDIDRIVSVLRFEARPQHSVLDLEHAYNRGYQQAVRDGETSSRQQMDAKEFGELLANAMTPLDELKREYKAS